MKKFVNLTAHPVNILLDGGDKITFPASGTIARVGMDQVKVGDIDGIPVFRTVFSKNITDLPAPALGVRKLTASAVFFLCFFR